MLELGFGFRGESMSHEFFTQLDMETRVSSRIGTREALFGPTAHLCGHLSEGVFFVVAVDPLGLHLGGRTGRNYATGNCRKGFEEHFRFDIIRTLLDRCAQFTSCSVALASSRE